MASEAGLKPFETEMMPISDVFLHIEAQMVARREDWERERITWYFIHSHSMVDKKYKKKSPERLYPFPWDRKQTRSRALSPQEILEAHRKMKTENGSN